jgi:electron transport complex protein RnfG
MEIVRMIVVLSMLTGLAGFILSGLKVWTTPIIEEQVLTYVQSPAIKQIFFDMTNDPIADRKKFSKPGAASADDQLIVFPIMKDGKLQAVAMEGAGKGYGGDVSVIVGIDTTTDKLVGISITTHKETPGLGSRVAEPGFTKQFKGRLLEKAKLKKDGGDIDAVSGATFSSIGATEAVKQVAGWYANLKDSIKTTWQ